MTSTTPPSSSHVLTFTDLIYASLASYGLPLFDTALQQKHDWAVAYLAAAAIWMFFDWYANHYFAIELALGGRNIPLDVISFFQYAGLLYASARTTNWIYVFLAIRGARGIAYNEIALRHSTIHPRDPNRLRSYNYSSGFMVVTYAALFWLDVSNSVFDTSERLAAAVGIWVLAYGIALLAEWLFDRNSAKQNRREQPKSRLCLVCTMLALLIWRAVRTSRSRNDKEHQGPARRGNA